MKQESIEVLQDAVSELLTDFADFLCFAPTEWAKHHKGVRALAQDVYSPCSVAVVGTVNSGKSSFVNAFFRQDLAVTDADECTAVLTKFRYGMKGGAVCCEYRDENRRKEWKDIEFVRSIQGNSEEVLKRAREIKCVTHYLPDDRLEQTVLVDTPGLGSTIEDNEATTRSIIELKQFHHEDTRQSAIQADAILLLVTDVEEVRTSYENLRDFFGRYDVNAYKVLCLCTMIDKTPEEERLSHCKAIEIELNRAVGQKVCYIPVSADVERMHQELTKDGLKSLQDRLKKSFPQKKDFDDVFSSEEEFDEAEPEGEWDVEKWMRYYKEELKIKFMAFAEVSRILYYNSFNDAMRKIESLSGFIVVRRRLEDQFFNCARLLKCRRSLEKASVILDGLRPLLEYQKDQAYIRSRDKTDFVDYITGNPSYSNGVGVGGKLLKFVDDNSIDRSVALNDELKSFKNRFFDLEVKIKHAYRRYDGLNAIDAASKYLSDECRKELELLFHGEKEFSAEDEKWLKARSDHWYEVQHADCQEAVRIVAKIACAIYDEIHYEINNNLKEQDEHSN